MGAETLGFAGAIIRRVELVSETAAWDLGRRGSLVFQRPAFNSHQLTRK
jgi:hypothetical protein